ncbi:MAG: DUF5686 and carboxypeptidase regulatory-like domain-containing protein [Flavobacteriales bacterium]|nr:DUF5686 and carboxypeptidase regulatory-like domain-containing protein [Flavobacteriales bacterium]MCX7769011.1 DUF5686 and carboxypeptidase regulatory-like domain-containing protein [Flavobacteriales bacterium]MDW8410200.1 DUF5686 family protein [Flavobacteriales bacterium]
MSIYWQSAQGQSTRIQGTVRDAVSRVPIPFVNILIKNTYQGTITGEDGSFTLETKLKADTLIVSAVGFKKQYIPLKSKEMNRLEIFLEPDNIFLTEVTIKYQGNPAEKLLKKVIDHKPYNDVENLDVYYTEVYNKVEIDVYNINDFIRKNPIVRPFDFIFQYEDTTDSKGRRYLPAFISETVSDRYFKKMPPLNKEVIKASKVAGSRNGNVSQFTGSMYQSVNIYRNFLVIAQKSFVSPIANSGIFFYRYYLADSVIENGQKFYRLDFYPRRNQDYTFNGRMWIHDSTFAVRSIYLELSENVNVNLIRALEAQLDFEWKDGRWFPAREKVMVDLNPVTKNSLSVIGRKTTQFRNQKAHVEIPAHILSNPNNIIVAEDAVEKPLVFWEEVRPDPLTKRELGIYKMIDTIKSTPTYKLYRSLGNMLTTGYAIVGPVEIGQYYKFFSYNPVEGFRWRFGGRTSNNLSKRFMLEASAAFGFRDKQFKYRAGFYWHFNKTKNPWRLYGIRYKYDLEQLSISEEQMDHDNTLNSIFRYASMTNLLFVRHLETFYEHEWFNGLTNKITFLHREVIPAGTFRFVRGHDTSQVYSHISTTELGFSTRFAFREKYIVRRIDRLSTGTRFPVVLVDYNIGIRGLWNATFGYHKLRIRIDDRVRLNPFGFFDYFIDAGKIWGAVPWPFLFNHPGNTSYMYDIRGFNLMQNLEFCADEYFSVFFSYHFDGFFFNRIPGFRKLKWREVVTGRALYASLRNFAQHRQLIRFPQPGTGEGIVPAIYQPYYEVGIGIENILRVFRLDFIWRLTNLNTDRNNDGRSDYIIPRWGIRGSFSFRF